MLNIECLVGGAVQVGLFFMGLWLVNLLGRLRAVSRGLSSAVRGRGRRALRERSVARGEKIAKQILRGPEDVRCAETGSS